MNDEIINEIPQPKKGKLKIFLGYCAGVGKTYAMLSEAHSQLAAGRDVVIGYIEPHVRPETNALIHTVPQIPTKQVVYKNLPLEEFDLDAAIERAPELILIDELAHTNIHGARNSKRYQDVEELLLKGIDVYTTINVQHIESLNNIVENITNVVVRETIPDYIFDSAERIKLVDIDPHELLNRLQEGKIYAKQKIEQATTHFFTIENLRLLREIAVHKIAEHISHENEVNQLASEKKANMKIMACISSGPSTPKCLRWAARTSRAFNTSWIAILVHNDDVFDNTEEEKILQKNIKLAEDLGGQVVFLKGLDIAETIAEYAQMSGISSIVIGKSTRTVKLSRFFRTSLEDKLIALVPAVEVHVISDFQAKNVPAEKVKSYQLLKRYFSFSWKDFIYMCVSLTIATIASLVLQYFQVEKMNFVIVYIVAVLIISRTTNGYFYGIASSIISVLIFDFYFIYPYDSFRAVGVSSLVTFVIMLMVALVTSGLVSRMKLQKNNLMSRQYRTELLYQINQKLLMIRGNRNISEVITTYLTDIFHRTIVFYMVDENGDEIIEQKSYVMERVGERAVNDNTIMQWVLENGKPAGFGTQTLSGTKFLFLPVIGSDATSAVIGFDCRYEKMSEEDIFFVQMILTQVAIALDRQKLSVEQYQISLKSETEKMKSNVLRSVSHDLRSPLTGIIGSISTILENKHKLSEDTIETLLYNIKDEAQWLIRMVENLLSVTRINDETMEVEKNLEAVDEVVVSACANVRRRYTNREIAVALPRELVFVEMDGVLIMQVIMNLLENAIKYSPAESIIKLSVFDQEAEVLFEVSDDGVGIADDILNQLFKQTIIKEDATSDTLRGLGIGLSICQSIVAAHGGSIFAENKKNGGAIIRFSLPKSNISI